MADTPPHEGLLERLRTPMSIVVGVATVVGAFAAVLVFFVPAAESGNERPSPTSGTAAPSAPPSVTPTSSGDTPAATAGTTQPTPTPGRDLAGLAPIAGAGFVTVDGVDIELGCPSNQSDDREREVRYDLTRSFTALHTSVSATGQSGPDDSAAIQVFIDFRQDRSDRRVETGRAVVTSGESAPISGSLKDAIALTLRLTCSSPSQVVRLEHPILVL